VASQIHFARAAYFFRSSLAVLFHNSLSAASGSGCGQVINELNWHPRICRVHSSERQATLEAGAGANSAAKKRSHQQTSKHGASPRTIRALHPWFGTPCHTPCHDRYSHAQLLTHSCSVCRFVAAYIRQSEELVTQGAEAPARAPVSREAHETPQQDAGIGRPRHAGRS
jgi:hypothetical protein